MAKQKAKNVGIPGIEIPKDVCKDANCPFHGNLGIRGRIYTATVVNKKTPKTAVVMWNRRLFVPKYERFEKRKSKIFAHSPECLHIRKDDKVLIGECRPISKAKRFTIIKKIEAEK